MTNWLRRLGLLVVFSSIVVATAAAIIGSSSNKTKTVGLSEIKASLKGIPQNANVLGRQNAPVQIMEFADLKCPACQEFHRETYSVLLKNYIGTGKVNWHLQLIGFLGSDSRDAALQAYSAAQQNMMFQYSLAYYFQGAAQAQNFSGINQARMYQGKTQAMKYLARAESLKQYMRVVETPTLFIRKTGSAWRRVPLPKLSLENLESAINKP